MEAFKDIFLEKYPRREKILQYYTDANGVEPEWGNITKVSLNRMVMQMEKTLSPNSARQYCAQVKAVLTLCSEESGLSFDYGSVLSLPEAMTTNVYVTEGEIDKLIHLSGLNKVEKYVRDQFVVGCLTGARHSDYSQFTPENARDGWLSYVSQKTRISCEIPVAPFVQSLISDGSEALKARLITDVHFNNILRKVCLKAGINGTRTSRGRSSSSSPPTRHGGAAPPTLRCGGWTRCGFPGYWGTGKTSRSVMSASATVTCPKKQWIIF